MMEPMGKCDECGINHADYTHTLYKTRICKNCADKFVNDSDFIYEQLAKKLKCSMEEVISLRVQPWANHNEFKGVEVSGDIRGMYFPLCQGFLVHWEDMND